MTPTQDYVYRFNPLHSPMAGRCRVRIYERERGVRVVLMTELNDNPGDSIAGACEQIATELTARWELKSQSTRWVLHDATAENLPPLFQEIRFAWDVDQMASDPRWQQMAMRDVETLTGETLASLDRRIGEPDTK